MSDQILSNKPNAAKNKNRNFLRHYAIAQKGVQKKSFKIDKE